MDMNLSAKDICSVIRACRANSVSKISLHGVEIEFGEVKKGDALPKWDIPTLSADESPSEVEMDEDEKDLQMALENPVEWERLQLEARGA